MKSTSASLAPSPPTSILISTKACQAASNAPVKFVPHRAAIPRVAKLTAKCKSS
ncbi:hypothetical protein D3C86_2226540 [compost metagenome]